MDLRLDQVVPFVEREVRREVQAAMKRTLVTLKAEAVKKSSGPFSLAALAKKGHPYARRYGPLGLTSEQPGGRPGIINVQTGAFRRGWFTDSPTMGDFAGSAVLATGRLANLDEKAAILDEGTEKMVRRPIKDELTAIGQEILEGEVRSAVRRLERRYGR